MTVNFSTTIAALLLVLTGITSASAATPDLFLLKTYDINQVPKNAQQQDFSNWVMSEKLDGIRGFWDGEKLLTKNGNALNPPKWFTANYPPFAIDGELWSTQNDFENISSIVRQKTPDERWHQITHQIFEVPNQQGNLFERLEVLQSYLNQQARKHPQIPIQIIPQISITNNNQIKAYLQKIIRNRGEGVVVRNPHKPYQTGRLKTALKIKPHYDDECIVSKIYTGSGKFTNKMGSIQCKTAVGKIVKIGSGFTDKQRENPPNIGDEITFKYYGLTKKGNFKFPVFLRIRHSMHELRQLLPNRAP